MRKKLVGVLCAVTMLGSLSMTVYASPQKPLARETGDDGNVFNWNQDTAVEMKNGDGTEVVTVNGQYIYNNSISNDFPYIWDSSLADSPCQIVKEDAYMIMPFDGYVSIGLVNLTGANNSYICVRAKAGDKVNMVPQNLVAVYDLKDPERQFHSDLVNTTADDWTYLLSIYPETFVPLRTVHSGEITENISISVPMYSYLMYCYHVDAPNTTLKSREVNWKAPAEIYSYDSNFIGWHEQLLSTGVSGAYQYLRKGRNITGWYSYGNDLSQGYYIGYDDYKSGLIEAKGDEIYIDGYKIDPINSAWTDPQYNIVNAQ